MFVIVGANGYLGSYLIRDIIKNTKDSIIATYNDNKPLNIDKSSRVKWVKLDVSESNSIEKFCQEELCNTVDAKFIYLAAYHHPDKVENNPKKAWNINVASLDEFLSKAKSSIGSLYYSSTDSVYGESIDGHIFSESDVCRPVNTYGRTKLAAEQVVLMHDFSVIRYSLLMGPSLLQKKHFYDIILESLEGGGIDMFKDSFRTAVSFDSAARFTISLLENHYKKRDILNIAGDNHLSKYDIACIIAKKLSLDSQLIRPAAMISSDFGSKRAHSTLVSNKKIKNILRINNIIYGG